MTRSSEYICHHPSDDVDLVADDHPLAIVGDLLVVGGGTVPAAGAGADGAASASIWEVSLNGVRGATGSVGGGSIRRIRRWG